MGYQPSTPGGGELCGGDKETICPSRVKWRRFQTFSVKDIGVIHRLEVRSHSRTILQYHVRTQKSSTIGCPSFFVHIFASFFFESIIVGFGVQNPM
jgi:hypothetical protein